MKDAGSILRIGIILLLAASCFLVGCDKQGTT